MEEVLQWIGTHWVEWLFCLIGIVLTFLAKHHVKVQKELLEEKWKDKEKNMCGTIITTFDTKISQVEKKSSEEDALIHHELDKINTEVDTIESGILSIQGKQFRELCEKLLKQDYITVEEYEDFEAEYDVYKSLGGNHRGDALHARVVAKYDRQKNKSE